MSASLLRVGFIGAGSVNFGGGEGPWDHASRLEQIEGLQVVGVADPNVDGAKKKLAERSSAMFNGARVFGDYRQMLDQAKPGVIWIGVPPNVHGTAEDGLDVELQCAEAGAHLFVEKPLSAFRPERVRPVLDAIKKSGVISGVGYMFRYSKAINAMADILKETALVPKTFMGRYNCAYSEIKKAEWWDVRESGGPIVEQATHFVDLARYLMGDVDLASVAAWTVKGSDPMGRLNDVPTSSEGARYDEAVPPEHRHPCATSAIWRYESGAVGSLVHGTLLHREKYESELEIWADGLRLVLLDPYGDCRLLVRRPHSDDTEEIRFEEDDPYLTEDQVFVEAVRSKDVSGIRSTYADAFKTFELTWAIADAGASH